MAERANWLTSVGAMMIPLAVALLQVIDGFSLIWASILMAIGAASIIAGLTVVVDSEKREREKAVADKVERLEDGKRRQREHRENLIMLVEIANQRGLSTVRLMRLLRRLEQESEGDEEMA